ncbi:hypothetical protein Pmani_012532 [Petrolisthes manimaculis]|uniref:Peptidase S1 domain-containing protein n=1 Tax=Petrolisthes manimaculis TaxID=1843537 RepID=A0AAE1UD40_9EUCA|nr:hypothetical protein Pmani_012532 [Petrolisthes manimaculis]
MLSLTEHHLDGSSVVVSNKWWCRLSGHTAGQCGSRLQLRSMTGGRAAMKQHGAVTVLLLLVFAPSPSTPLPDHLGHSAPQASSIHPFAPPAPIHSDPITRLTTQSQSFKPVDRLESYPSSSPSLSLPSDHQPKTTSVSLSQAHRQPSILVSPLRDGIVPGDTTTVGNGIELRASITIPHHYPSPVVSSVPSTSFIPSPIDHSSSLLNHTPLPYPPTPAIEELVTNEEVKSASHVKGRGEVFSNLDKAFMSEMNESATITQEEFNSILTRFSLDALQATQIAERLGLAGSGVAELEEELALGGNLEGPAGPHDRPYALPLGRNPRTTSPARSPGSEYGGLSRATRRLFLGDPTLCYTGTCEFFLMCWLRGGLIDGGCGGFLFACCSHGTQRGQRGHQSYRQDSSGITPVDYGPIRNDHGCGLSTSSRLSAQRRIVGGTEAGFGSFPWQAYIRIGSSRCGGSLINQYHVVTAGHCVARARPQQVRVTLGDYVLNSESEPLAPVIYGATDIKVHPNFKFTPQADRFDVAVIKLDSPVHYQPHVQPICLPEKGTDWLGSYGWAAGWGALQSGSRLRPKTLQVVDVPILDSRLCEDWHRQKGINVIIYDEMMCAGYNQGGKDSCQGDSGGPLMIQDGGRWYLAGIVSAGYSCAQGKQPGIYHKVSYTSDWISWAANS